MRNQGTETLIVAILFSFVFSLIFSSSETFKQVGSFLLVSLIFTILIIYLIRKIKRKKFFDEQVRMWERAGMSSREIANHLNENRLIHGSY